MKRIIMLFLITQSYALSLSLRPLYHGLAVSDAQKGDWLHASERMNRLLATSYDDPSLLYDAGVAAYKVGQFEQAYTYFDDCCQKSHDYPAIQERSYFNKGNVCVDLNKLEEAIKAYELTLALNPKNQVAQHNLNKVKEMLQQQKQQQKDDQQKNDQDQKKEQEDQKSEKNDQNKSDSSKNNQSNEKNNEEMNNDSQQEKKDGEGQPDSGNNNAGGESSPQDRKRENAQEEGSDQEKSKRNDSKDSQSGLSNDTQDQDVSQRRNKRDSGSDKETQKKQDKTQHGKEEKSKQGDTKNQKKEQAAGPNGSSEEAQGQTLEKRNEQATLAAQQKNDDLFDKQHTWMAQLLEAQENADQNAHKKMVKTAIKGAVTDDNGYNCW